MFRLENGRDEKMNREEKYRAIMVQFDKGVERGQELLNSNRSMPIIEAIGFYLAIKSGSVSALNITRENHAELHDLLTELFEETCVVGAIDIGQNN
jgi:hypothetical protein